MQTEQHLIKVSYFICICQIAAKFLTYVNKLRSFYNLAFTEALCPNM